MVLEVQKNPELNYKKDRNSKLFQSNLIEIPYPSDKSLLFVELLILFLKY